MNARTPALLAAGAILAMAPQINAAMVTSFDFETPAYNLGALAGQQGWADSTSPTNMYQVVAGDFGAGQNLRFAQASNGRASVAIPAQTGDIFLSFSYKPTEANFMWFALDNDIDEASCLTVAHRFDGGSNLFARARTAGSNNQSVGAPVDASGTVVSQIVMRVWKSGTNGDSYDRVAAWVNPTPGEEATPDITSNGGATGITSINTFWMRTGGTTAPNPVYAVDDLQIATSFSDVVVPEPTLLSLAGLAGLALLRRRSA